MTIHIGRLQRPILVALLLLLVGRPTMARDHEVIFINPKAVSSPRHFIQPIQGCVLNSHE